jgi:hypothetical protein
MCFSINPPFEQLSRLNIFQLHGSGPSLCWIKERNLENCEFLRDQLYYYLRAVNAAKLSREETRLADAETIYRIECPVSHQEYMDIGYRVSLVDLGSQIRLKILKVTFLFVKLQLH